MTKKGGLLSRRRASTLSESEEYEEEYKEPEIEPEEEYDFVDDGDDDNDFEGLPSESSDFRKKR